MKTKKQKNQYPLFGYCEEVAVDEWDLWEKGEKDGSWLKIASEAFRRAGYVADADGDEPGYFMGSFGCRRIDFAKIPMSLLVKAVPFHWKHSGSWYLFGDAYYKPATKLKNVLKAAQNQPNSLNNKTNMKTKFELTPAQNEELLTEYEQMRSAGMKDAAALKELPRYLKPSEAACLTVAAADRAVKAARKARAARAQAPTAQKLLERLTAQKSMETNETKANADSATQESTATKPDAPISTGVLSNLKKAKPAKSAKKAATVSTALPAKSQLRLAKFALKVAVNGPEKVVRKFRVSDYAKFADPSVAESEALLAKMVAGGIDPTWKEFVKIVKLARA